MADKKKFYVVWQGHNPGIYDNWDKCQQQIKNYPNAKYKSFGSREEADIAFGGNFAEHIQFKSPTKPGTASSSTREPQLSPLVQASSGIASVWTPHAPVTPACWNTKAWTPAPRRRYFTKNTRSARTISASSSPSFMRWPCSTGRARTHPSTRTPALLWAG